MSKTLSSLLYYHNNSVVQQIVQKAEHLASLERLIKAHLNTELAHHIRLAQYRQGTLLLFAENGHWATNLRFQQYDLVATLQKLPELKELQAIEIRVCPAVFSFDHFG